MQRIVRLLLVGLMFFIVGVVLYAENKEEKAIEDEQAEIRSSAEENAKDITVSTKEVNETGVSEPKSYWLGLQITPVPEIFRSHFGITEKSRGLAIIEQVVPESPADKAGLKRSDVILLFGGKEISNLNDLIEQVSIVKDTEQKMSLIRAGKPLEVTIKPEPRPVAATMIHGYSPPMEQFSQGFPRGFPQGMIPPGMALGREFFVGPHDPQKVMEEIQEQMKEQWEQMQGGQINLPSMGGTTDGSSKRLEVSTQTNKEGKTSVQVKQVTRSNGQTEEKSWEAESVDQLPEEIRKEVQNLFRVQ